MNKFKLLIITIFCLIPSIVFPFVSYNVLIKDGKLVLLMGDAHSTEIDEINTQHIDYLFAVLNNSLSKLSNKVNCLIEIHPSLFKALYLNKQSNDANMAKTIDHLCSSYIKNAFFNFVPCDTRGQESDIIMSVGGSINNLISEMVFKDETPNEDIQIPEKASFEFKKFEKMINDMGRCNYSLKMHIQYLRQTLNTVQSFNILPKYIIKYEKCIENFEKFFSGNLNENISDFFINLFKKCKNLKSAYDLNRLLHDQITQSDLLYANICFYNSIIKDQLNNSNTAIICGDAHFDVLVEMLLQNGYVSISSLDSKTQNGYVTAYDIKPDFAKKLADVTLDFLKHLNSTISSSSSSVSSSSNSVTEKKTNLVMQRCNFCNKKSVNNTFKQCIGCMQVHYCSPKCQQYDWEFHKNICNCLAGKKQLYLVTDIHLDENNE